MYEAGKFEEAKREWSSLTGAMDDPQFWKLALAVLSGIEPVELIKAIRLQDVARLTAIR